jgi:DNA-directed RNA polymerase specialized sigma24 family protein
LNTLDDNAIMLKVKAGDLDRMGLLFQRYHRQLYGFLFHMTYQREASEDMVQQVFYKNAEVPRQLYRQRRVYPLDVCHCPQCA